MPPHFIRHSGVAAPFLRNEIEVEFIAPVGPELHDLHGLHTGAEVVSLEPHAHDGTWVGEHALPGFRFRPDGSEDPDFILNQEPYRNATILLAGRNFGQGSLQAFAAIRLRRCGFRSIIAPSFGPVFQDDCFDYGILPVTLAEGVVARIAELIRARPALLTTVDLVRQVIERDDMPPVGFQLDARRRNALLAGVDGTLDERLQRRDSAAAARNEDRRARPWIYDTRRN